jgi:hypothetical protein
MQQNSNKTALVERSSYLSLASEILNSATTTSANELDEPVTKTLMTLGQLCGSSYKFCKDLLEFDNGCIHSSVLNLLSAKNVDLILREGLQVFISMMESGFSLPVLVEQQLGDLNNNNLRV